MVTDVLRCRPVPCLDGRLLTDHDGIMVARKGDKPAPDEIVRQVLGDAHEPIAGVVCVGGFVGVSPRANNIRLFTTMDFSECLDIPLEGIVSHEKVERPGIPGGTYVWIRRDAVVGLSVVEPRKQLTSFLQGPILRDHPAAARISVGTVGGGAGFFSTPICTIVVSLATVTILVCTRIRCPDPSDECPEPPEPISFTETEVF
jgi:hypothetical protein